MNEPRPPGIVSIRCPECKRWLQDVRDYGRAVCPACGAEVTYRSREERRRASVKPFLSTSEDAMMPLETATVGEGVPPPGPASVIDKGGGWHR